MTIRNPNSEFRIPQSRLLVLCRLLRLAVFEPKSAVDGEYAAGDVIGIIGDQKRGSFADVGGQAETPPRKLFSLFFDDVIGN